MEQEVDNQSINQDHGDFGCCQQLNLFQDDEQFINDKQVVIAKDGSIRDRSGRFLPGSPGYKEKRVLLTTELKRQLMQGNCIDEVVQATIQLAKNGHTEALKMVWNRIDGMQTQKTEITGANGEPLQPAVIILPSNGSEVRQITSDIQDAEYSDIDQDRPKIAELGYSGDLDEV